MYRGIVAQVAAGRYHPPLAADMIVVVAQRTENYTIWTQLAASWLDSGVGLGKGKDEDKGRDNGKCNYCKDKGMDVQHT